MTRSHYRSQNDNFILSRDSKAGGNTPEPHSGFGGFSREKLNFRRRFPVGAFVNERGSPGLTSDIHPNIGNQNSGDATWHLSEIPSFPDTLGFGADLALRADIAQTDFSALITAMEMRSTIVGLGSLSKRLGDAYGALRRGNLRGFTQALDVSKKSSMNVPPKKVMDNASSYLLEYQFGIVSLYNDMLGLATTLYDQSQFPARLKFKATEKQSISEEMTAGLSPTFLWTDSEVRTHGSVEIQGRATGTAIYKAITDVVVNSPCEFYLSQFGFTNPAHAVYSVLPNSWLFDAFVPLGDFLSQLYLPPGISLENSGTVKIIELDINFPGQTFSGGTYTYSYPDGEDIHQGVISESIISRAMNGSYFNLMMAPADFTSPSFQIRPKLPFVGQAITSSAYAHQRSDDLKKLLSKNLR